MLEGYPGSAFWPIHHRELHTPTWEPVKSVDQLLILKLYRLSLLGNQVIKCRPLER